LHLDDTTRPMILRLLRVLAFALLLLATPLYAQDTVADNETTERFGSIMDETEERLQLTDSQKETVRPILNDDQMQRQAILNEYGIDLENIDPDNRPGRRTLLKMRRDMNKVNKRTEKQLASVLTADQMAEWGALQEERREKMRDRLQGNG